MSMKKVEDPDLKGARRAMRRVVWLACERARQTGTRLAVWRNGRVELIPPEQLCKEKDHPHA